VPKRLSGRKHIDCVRKGLVGAFRSTGTDIPRNLARDPNRKIAKQLCWGFGLDRIMETSALGAALWALLGTGARESLEKTADFIKLGDPCRPNPSNAEIYNRMYPLFEKLYEALQKSFQDAAELQAGFGR
jgi:hypothetical protein